MPVQIQTQRIKKDLADFKKLHSKTFLYFLEEYEKYQELKRKTDVPSSE